MNSERGNVLVKGQQCNSNSNGTQGESTDNGVRELTCNQLTFHWRWRVINKRIRGAEDRPSGPFWQDLGLITRLGDSLVVFGWDASGIITPLMCFFSASLKNIEGPTETGTCVFPAPAGSCVIFTASLACSERHLSPPHPDSTNQIPLLQSNAVTNELKSK